MEVSPATERSGFLSALETLYVQDRGVLMLHALKSVRTPEDAEDVLQQAYLNAFRFGGYQGANGASLRTWFCTVITNAARDMHRKQRTRGGTHVDIDEALGVSVSTPNPEELAASSERRRKLHTACGVLSPILQNAVRVYLLEVGVKTGAMKLRKLRAVRRLRDLMRVQAR